MPRLLISNPSALLILNAAISARAARIVSNRYHVQYVWPPREAGSGPSSRSGPPKSLYTKSERLLVAKWLVLG